MKPADIVLALLPQADGQAKLRPTLVLCQLRPFDDLLVCGISTQLRQRVPDFDELIGQDDADFAASGLAAPSIVRLGFIATVPLSTVKGRIGTLTPARHSLLIKRLTDHLATAIAGR